MTAKDERKTKLAMRVAVSDRVASLLSSATLVVGVGVGWLAALWLLQETPPPTRPHDLVAGHSITGQRGDRGGPAIWQPAIAAPVETDLTSVAFELELSQAFASARRVAEQTHRALPPRLDNDRVGVPAAGRGVGDEVPFTREAGQSSQPAAFQRWEIRFQAADLNGYARQLDYFGIELGCIGGGIADVDYAFQLSTEPTWRRGPSRDETRLYFAWRSPNELANHDRVLLHRAGIDTSGRLSLRFIPHELEKQLAALELQHAKLAGQGGFEAIRQTVFRTAPNALGYQFEVIAQTYR